MKKVKFTPEEVVVGNLIGVVSDPDNYTTEQRFWAIQMLHKWGMDYGFSERSGLILEVESEGDEDVGSDTF